MMTYDVLSLWIRLRNEGNAQSCVVSPWGRRFHICLGQCGQNIESEGRTDGVTRINISNSVKRPWSRKTNIDLQ